MADLTLVPRCVPPGVALSAFRVRGEQASLGRGAHCDWVLPDPQRLLSKRHCEISLRGGQWLITDFSSNGTTVRGETLPPGVPQELHDGDTIGCGSYLIDIALDAADADDATQSVPRAERPATDERALPPLSGEFGRRGLSPGDGPVFDMGDHHRYGRTTVETLSIIHPFSFALSDSDGAFDLPGATAPTDPAGTVRGGEAPSGLHDSFRPPRPVSVLLPEDWDSPGTLAGPRATEVASASDVEALAETPVNPFAVPRDEAREVPLPRPAETPSLGQGTRDERESRDTAALAALMRGAGIEGTPSERSEAFFEELGRTFRALVVGLRRAMIARAKVKSEFRIEQTMIRPFGNNPLKFAVDDDDALSAMLGVGRRTGISGSEAVADALRDIRVHEMAVTRAIEPAIREFLAVSGPSAVLEQLSFPADQPLPLLRRAKAWTTYVRQHEDLAASLTETLDGTFGRAFGHAYEAAREEIEAAESRAAHAQRRGVQSDGREDER
ncbi:FHA domain-containing protein [Ameyamaea chiangmaiensis NBRC 103196]|uniref:Type VI secretion system-associated FHA domain protein TagH n=1 Tax=Ameyamaea chiangmaiensis TaxID=442969 RepID=A0A850PDQ7_9PROT|nr:type VI secretion system-associated FHA domain protein TagH [Ameyamaea chiangmaiensis]MBS4076100.1 type VI secretion system-associated FHA domain protein TagH [Ameyamaea chiangmaiensis]NVN40610.1 type VI secretion system-associated FHA domain protein TagH [Ameyamaea chiangmaiensis]GBQ67019.1 FHA domain-containing protein [Ameyamaea chiangmaiensis NBRC 103196]